MKSLINIEYSHDGNDVYLKDIELEQWIKGILEFVFKV